MSYVLIADDEADILELFQLIVSSMFAGEVHCVQSGEEAVAVMSERGAPSLIITDDRMSIGEGVFLAEAIPQLFPSVPFIVCSRKSEDEIRSLFPNANGFVLKPNIQAPLTRLLQALIPEVQRPQYVLVPMQTLLRLGIFSYDTYVRLSDQKFVKVRHASDPLGDSELDELIVKYRGELFITERDASEIGEKLLGLTRGEAHSTLQSGDSVARNLTAMLSYAELFGWTAEAVEASQRFVLNSMAVWSKQKAWIGLLPDSKKNEFYNSHVLRLAQLSCMFAQQVGLTSDAVGEKLIMAAILHDSAIRAQDFEDRINFKEDAWRDHPQKAAEMARRLPGSILGVDHIILMHHERPDGKGFPRGLFAQQIFPLSAVFILAHEFLEFVGDGKLDAKLMEQFKIERSIYLKGSTFGRFAPLFEQSK